jgi:FkbM family methyltransferase
MKVRNVSRARRPRRLGTRLLVSEPERKNLKARAGQLLRVRGLEVRGARGVPFGVRWEDDIASLLGGTTLSLALDVGANQGQTAMRLRRRFPGAEIHSFEPSSAAHDRLVANTRHLNVHCVRAAMGDREGEGRLARAGTGHGSFHASGPAETVRIETVDGYCDRGALDAPTLLKIDTEGHEVAVLNGASRRLDRGAIRFVLCECQFSSHPAEPHGSFFEVAELLLSRGYRVVSFYTGGVDGLGWRWGDVLFTLPSGPEPGRVTASPHER